MAHNVAPLLTEAGSVDPQPKICGRARRLIVDEVCALYAAYSWVRALDHDEKETLSARIHRLAHNKFDRSAPNVVLKARYSDVRPAEHPPRFDKRRRLASALITRVLQDLATRE